MRTFMPSRLPISTTSPKSRPIISSASVVIAWQRQTIKASDDMSMDEIDMGNVFSVKCQVSDENSDVFPLLIYESNSLDSFLKGSLGML